MGLIPFFGYTIALGMTSDKMENYTNCTIAN
jgi:hypothetical protein